MLERCRNAQERWGGVHRLIDRWLEERQTLIQSLIHLDDGSGSVPEPALRQLCELLVDYCSSGHFEIYQQLLAEAEAFDDQAALALAGQIFPQLQAITTQILAFSDHCAQGRAGDREQLGHQLLVRFGLEDQLIEVLHTAHAAQLSH